MKIYQEIYLITKDEEGNELEEVLWCEDDIYGNGIKYSLVEPRLSYLKEVVEQ